MSTRPSIARTQLDERWTFNSLVIYAPDRFHARQAYERIMEGALPEAFGTMVLAGGVTVRWVDLSRKSRDKSA
jgi:hypothetical protein